MTYLRVRGGAADGSIAPGTSARDGEICQVPRPAPPHPTPRVKPAGGDAYGGRLIGGRGNEGRRRCFEGDEGRSQMGQVEGGGGDAKRGS